MGIQISRKVCNFQDIQEYIYIKKKMKDDSILLINTLSNIEQNCLIYFTKTIEEEIRLLNEYMYSNKDKIKIFIYGKNCNDTSVYTKYDQLKNIGFNHIYIYTGGLFEWLLLQDIYGDENFPTTSKELDLIKYKCKSDNEHIY